MDEIEDLLSQNATPSKKNPRKEAFENGAQCIEYLIKDTLNYKMAQHCCYISNHILLSMLNLVPKIFLNHAGI